MTSTNNRFDLNTLQEFLREFVHERDWEQFHSPKNLSMALAGEVGELVEIFHWVKEEDSFHVMDNPKTAEEVRDEIADVIIYCSRLADVLKLNVAEAVWQKIEKNEHKYPVNLAKGNAKKYTELQNET